MKQAKIFKQQRIRFLNNALLVDDEILVLGDLHLGVQQALGIPEIQLKGILEDLEEIFSYLGKLKIKLKKIVVLGDFKHKFGEISDEEWREGIKLLDCLIGKIRKKNLVLIKGNHDSILKPILKKRKIRLVDYYLHKDVVFMHGDKEYEILKKKNIKKIILGHLHPALVLSDGYKKERYKCFLKGNWRKKQAYILPSFGESGPGYNLTKGGIFKRRERLFISERDLKNFDVVVYNNKDKKEHNFGKIRDLT